MSHEIKRTDYGFSKYSPKELDAIMLEHNGVLGQASEETTPHSNADQVRHGWRTIIIGAGNDKVGGRLTLIPTNQHTTKIWRKGKIAWLKTFGITETHALAILQQQEVQFRFEDGVARAVVELLNTEFNQGTLRGVYSAGKTWKARTGLRIELPFYDALSRRRQETAVTLALLAAPEGNSTIKLSL